MFTLIYSGASYKDLSLLSDLSNHQHILDKDYARFNFMTKQFKPNNPEYFLSPLHQYDTRRLVLERINEATATHMKKVAAAGGTIDLDKAKWKQTGYWERPRLFFKNKDTRWAKIHANPKQTAIVASTVGLLVLAILSGGAYGLYEAIRERKDYCGR